MQQFKQDQPTLKYYLQAANKLAIPYLMIADNFAELDNHGNPWRIYRYHLPVNPSVAKKVSVSKQLTVSVLKRFGLPVLESSIHTDSHSALQIFREKNGRIVVKPDGGSEGKGVTVLPENEQALVSAFTRAAEISAKVMLEDYAQGRHLRIVIANGKVLAAAERTKVYVSGEGKSSIAQLIENRNSQLREKGFKFAIEINDSVTDLLATQGLNLESVANSGAEVLLNHITSLSKGSHSIDVLEQVHPEIKSIAAEAARVMQLNFAGVDLIASDFTVKPSATNPVVINEVNSSPGVAIHNMADNAPAGYNIAEQILAEFFGIKQD